jgi:23S rRNA (adenine2030-N6)-methyltransferase
MRYRHQFHAGNFADLHKHVTLLTLLRALQRKNAPLAYFDTHAGAGCHLLSAAPAEARSGALKFMDADYASEELRDFHDFIASWRAETQRPRAYPGSPVIAARTLRAQDRAQLAEIRRAPAAELSAHLARFANVHVECADGYERLRAWLPPRERRALVLIDPPYEARDELARVSEALGVALKRFRQAVIAVWYPIKDARPIEQWHRRLRASLQCELLAAELWLYPRDSAIALNGSGILLANPPYRIAERMQVWLPELEARLDVGSAGGTRVTKLMQAA